MANDKLELVRQALAVVGDASPEELAAFIETRHGIRIEPRFIPIIRASLRELDLLEKAKATARAMTEQEKVVPKTRDSTDGPAKPDLAIIRHNLP